MIKKETKISESVFCGLILALSGGAMDAYSYLFRDEVFANAQTGNMLLLGVNIANCDFSNALRYFGLVIAFVGGIILSDLARYRFNKMSNLHWKQISLAFEILILIFVAFVPVSRNQLANAMTSFACGIQVQSFRSIRGNSIATTMCIGNLRSATQYMDKYIHFGDRGNIRKSALYFGVIFAFVFGAVIEGFLIKYFKQAAIIFSPVLLAIALILMFIYKNEEDEERFTD